MLALAALASRLNTAQAVLVQVERAQGSVPREAGAWMAVFADHVLGTIGGGHLEFQAITQARQCLDCAELVPLQRFALGPSLGQCCGGVAWLRYEWMAQGSGAVWQQRLAAALTPVALFGGGHVGRALVDVLARLPFRVRWIDSRDEVFPVPVPWNVSTEHSDPVQHAVSELIPQSRVLIMSFSHAEDLDVLAACLQRQRERADLPYIGLIGSRTKWATFRHRLSARGYEQALQDQVTCPIGVPGIEGKEPEVIAVAVAAQLLQGHPGNP